MEQLTVREHFVSQLRRAPSFAVAACVVGLGLLVSAFITFSVGREPALAFPYIAGVAEAEPTETLPKFKLTAPALQDDVKDRKIEPREWEVAAATESPKEEEKWIIEEVKFDDELSLAPPDTWEGGNPFDNNTPVIGSRPTRGLKGPGGVYGRRNLGPWGRGVCRLPRDTGPAINWGLRWLAQAQDKKTGGWDVKRWGGSSDDSATGVSGLALLAFLSSGSNDDHPRRYAKTVRAAVEFLISQQRSEGTERGWFGARMYTQGICTMALSEASVLLRSPRLKSLSLPTTMEGQGARALLPERDNG